MESVIGRIVATILSVVLLAGVGYLAYAGFSSNKVSKFTSQTGGLVQAVNQIYASSASFTGLSTMPAANLSQIKDMWASSAPGTATIGTAGTLIDPWGNGLQVLGGGDAGIPSGVTVSPAQFVLVDPGTHLARSDCQAIAGALSGSAFATYVNGSIVGSPGSPITPSAIATACNADGLPMAFVYGH
jgi:hypothetical protein